MIKRVFVFTIKFVEVDLVDAISKLLILSPELPYSALVEFDLFFPALSQSLPHLVDNHLREPESIENHFKLPLNLLLAHVVPAAGAFVESTVVIDIALLLSL